jgi:hypothetical protein
MNALRSVMSTFNTIRHTLRSTTPPQADEPDFDPQYKPYSSREMEPTAEQMHNIYHIGFLLRQKLIRDVVPAILEYAELYSSTTSSEEFDPSLRISQREAPKQLIECKIAKVKTRVLRPVRKITFKISSHDQGFASDLSKGSWTWFTARKCMPEMDLLPGSMLEVDDRNEAEYSHHREICSNVVASRQWRTHEISWRADSLDPVEAEWVSSFVAGDRFAVYAWANYPAWVNHVGDISVTVHYVAAV